MEAVLASDHRSSALPCVARVAVACCPPATCLPRPCTLLPCCLLLPMACMLPCGCCHCCKGRSPPPPDHSPTPPVACRAHAPPPTALRYTLYVINPSNAARGAEGRNGTGTGTGTGRQASSPSRPLPAYWYRSSYFSDDTCAAPVWQSVLHRLAWVDVAAGEASWGPRTSGECRGGCACGGGVMAWAGGVG